MYGKLQESWQLTMLCEHKNEKKIKKANILTVVYDVDGRKKGKQLTTKRY